jgi:hypothetical protein
VHDAGDGPALYAGGSFQSAGGVAASCIAKWNGASWSALGSGVDDSLGFRSVDALASCDVAGPVLYVGGTFTTAGGLAAGNIAKWDGQGWTGSGFNDAPRAMAVYDDGGGPALYAGGYFTSAGGVAVSHVARWNGSSWSPLGSGISSEVFSLCVHDDGGGPAIACPTARAKS